MVSILDPRLDEKIRDAIRSAAGKGKLDVVAAVTGIAGGEEALREIMNSDGELAVKDRGMLALHLN